MEHKKARRANLIGMTPLRHDVQSAKLALSNHLIQQGRSSVHVSLKDRGHQTKHDALRIQLVDHVTSIRVARAEIFLFRTAVEPTIGHEMFSD